MKFVKVTFLGVILFASNLVEASTKDSWASECHKFMEKYVHGFQVESNYTAKFMFDKESKENNIYVSNISFISDSGKRESGSFHCQGDESFNVTKFIAVGRYVFTVKNGDVVKRFDLFTGESTKFKQ